MAARRGAHQVLLLASMFAISGACAHSVGLAHGRQTPVFGGAASDLHPPLAGWHGIKLSSPGAADAIRRALDEASRRLLDPVCQKLVSEFRDDAGQLLSERLAYLRVDVRSYLGWIQFHDGTTSFCGNGWTLMYTVPGSRIVNVCKVAVEDTAVDHRDYLVAAVIHEVLHTLGLNENPPSSADITRSVQRRCWVAAR